MAEWRIGRGWDESAIERHLQGLQVLSRNFEEDPEALPAPEWRRHSSEAVLTMSDPGPPRPGGPFERGRDAVARYAFSDERIVRAHFDVDAPLAGRRMLLEIQAFGLIRYLSGVVVGEVRSDRTNDESVFGFRYDTLEGHIERGTEWFILRKRHESGEIRFRIAAAWRPGDFPNAWSRLGFQAFGAYYQNKWHREAHRIMSDIVEGREKRTRRPPNGGPDILFERT